MQCAPRIVCVGHSVQSLPNAFGLLFYISACFGFDQIGDLWFLLLLVYYLMMHFI